MTNLQKAYLGMQCFWGAESTFAELDGVLATRVGYAGGTTPLPNYRNIGDHTGMFAISYTSISVLNTNLSNQKFFLFLTYH